MIHARRGNDKRDEGHDLFSGLLDAADEEAGERVAISDRELMGKLNLYDSPYYLSHRTFQAISSPSFWCVSFCRMVNRFTHEEQAGHETTAHTICCTALRVTVKQFKLTLPSYSCISCAVPRSAREALRRDMCCVGRTRCIGSNVGVRRH